LSEPESRQEENPVTSHLLQAARHAEKAIRCYIHLLASKAGGLGHALVRQVVMAFALTALGLMGLLFVSIGLAKWLETGLGMPEGAGLLCVGIGIICTALVCVLVVRNKGGG